MRGRVRGEFGLVAGTGSPLPGSLSERIGNRSDDTAKLTVFRTTSSFSSSIWCRLEAALTACVHKHRMEKPMLKWGESLHVDRCPNLAGPSEPMGGWTI